MKQFNPKTILVTGGAGFIGYHLIRALLDGGTDAKIVALDNLNDYYDPALKTERLRLLEAAAGRSSATFTFIKGDLADADLIRSVFAESRPQIVVNLAAQAGVRYSITNPDAYIQSNLIGFYNILEACRHAQSLEHLVFASSSSVYGSNEKVPYSEEDQVDNPVSLYAATKKSGELLAHSYAKLYGIPSTGLRFFTVYGPLGRPDMAYFGFTNKMVAGESIKIFNHGDLYRDFTYVDDIVRGVLSVMASPAKPNAQGVPYEIYNIGNNHPESLMDFISILENCLMQEGIITAPAKKEYLPMQPGDVYQTYADTSKLERDFGFKPATPLSEGLARFAAWYRSYYLEKENPRQ
ncbi:MAG: NAD-dependent epimerase/dehydratase family protein [Clostridia bacterium]|nr:NAD-dependent epimerase/dehydratase family protein [Clostridia bacterium]